MGIKISHTHNDGRVCFETHPRHALSDKSLISLIDDKNHVHEYAVAYMIYTGSYYSFDINTGREVAKFSREFYETIIKPMISTTLVPDPDCKI
jgi:hypothetical protein